MKRYNLTKDYILNYSRDKFLEELLGQTVIFDFKHNFTDEVVRRFLENIGDKVKIILNIEITTDLSNYDKLVKLNNLECLYAVNIIHAKIIPKQFFKNCPNLSVVRFPDKLEAIYEAAFYECPIKYVNVPESVKFIGVNAFYTNRYQPKIKLISIQSKDNLILGDISAEYVLIYATNIAFCLLDAKYQCKDVNRIIFVNGLKSDVVNNEFNFGNSSDIVLIDSRTVLTKNTEKIFKSYYKNGIHYTDTELLK